MSHSKARFQPAATHHVAWLVVTWLLVALNAIQFIAAYQIQLRGMAHTHSSESQNSAHLGHTPSPHFHGSLSHHRHAYTFDTAAASAQWQDQAAHVHAEATDSAGSSACLWAGLFFLPLPQASSGLSIRRTEPQPPLRVFYTSFHPTLPDRPPAAALLGLV